MKIYVLDCGWEGGVVIVSESREKAIDVIKKIDVLSNVEDDLRLYSMDITEGNYRVMGELR